VGITWGLPHYVDWVQDSIALETLDGISKFFANGWFDKYPPLHYMILGVCYVPYIGYLILSGQLQTPSKMFPYGLVDPLQALTHFILIARVISVLMGVAVVYLVYRIVWELFDRRAALFSALMVALGYPLVYYAHNANVEIPYVFWTMLALYHLVRLLQQGALKNYLLFALFGMLAICTKDQAYGLFLITLLLILWKHFTESPRHSGPLAGLMHALFDKRLLLAAAVCIVTFSVAQNLLFNFSGFLRHVEWITGGGMPYAESGASPMAHRSTLLGETVTLLVVSLTPPLFVLCLLGCGYCAFRFPRKTLPLLLLIVSYYLSFVSVVQYVSLRYLIPVTIIMAFFGGRLLAEIWDWGARQRLLRVAVCLVFVYAALFPIQVDLLMLYGESRYAAERWMRQHMPPGTLVETFARSHLHLCWFWPRFPSWVKVRTSNFATSNQWEPRVIKPEKIRLPNLYQGKESPDYIVLSSGDRDLRTMSDLYNGRMGYKLVATFKASPFVPVDLQIDTRIDILERTTTPPAVSDMPLTAP
jgi:hypothetical protein